MRLPTDMRFRALAGALCLVLLLPIPKAAAEAAADAIPYDVNLDGALSEDDAAAILSACLLDAAADGVPTDYNFDESGTAADAAVLLRYVHGDVSRFPTASGGYPALSDGETVAAARRILRRVLTIDFAGYAERLAGVNMNVYGDIARSQPVFTEMAGDMNRAIAHAAGACLPLVAFDLSDLGIPLAALKTPKRSITWREMAALYRTFGDGAARMLADTLTVDLALDGADGAVFSVELSLFSEMTALGTEEEQLTARFTLAYLNTVYDDAGVMTDYIEYELPASYLSALIHPLNNETGQYWIKDGWYDARSRRTRLHTGTDILAPARTPIHSMTDGVVLFVGYMPTPGNYVIVRDPYGFEYHYYHMVEQSTFVEEGDFVSRGDVIGLVGNTGNSAANHLHLTIISPEFTYINPYDVFLAAGITPIRIN